MLNVVIFVTIGLVYMVLKVYLERRLAPLDAAGNERRLADLAFACGCSEYALFKRSAQKWGFSNRKIEQDFKHYVNTGHLPTYVHDYLAQHSKAADNTYQRLIFSGGRPPYL